MPFEFIYGKGKLLPAIESSLEGKKTGEEFDLLLAPADAFGVADEQLKKKIPVSQMLQCDPSLHEGDIISLQDNEEQLWLITNIKDGEVYLDANHLWAGKTLDIHIKIENVRPATQLELIAGNVIREDVNTCGPGCRC
jgi:FKBP-type peptidyl-prolyl cis-trans isomerase SlyD